MSWLAILSIRQINSEKIEVLKQFNNNLINNNDNMRGMIIYDVSY